MKVVEVRNVKIGEGIPKICVPIVGKTKEEILAEAVKVAEVPADVVEWRADWYDQVMDAASVLDTGAELRQVLGEVPLLFTFRTAAEGGEKSISREKYEELNRSVAESGWADFIDVEAFLGEDVGKRLIEAAHQRGVKVIASNHDFEQTPSKDEIIRRLRYMQDLDADIPKIAVMPKNTREVLELLSATAEMNEIYADRPIITMSMAKEGVISRVCGEVFGSALTFGTAGKASAPGQVEAGMLANILETLHELLQ